METFNARYAAAAGLPPVFAQDNHSYSGRGVLRGLHFQFPTWQAKLVRAVTGEIFDVAVDVRPGSPSFGRWFGMNLSAQNRKQMLIPDGFAHGFCVLSESADVVYKCTTSYAPAEDRCILWNDPDIGVKWPIAEPLVSDKDARGLRLRDLRFD
jgi:dTDP-4-dehydrorhamnose 3,5-epimerase